MLRDHPEGWEGTVGVGGRLKRDSIYIYIYIELIHFIAQQKHNTAKQLFSNFKKRMCKFFTCLLAIYGARRSSAEL